MTELTEDDTVTARADKSALLAKRTEQGPSGFPEDDVMVPGFGTVHVRGLSRFEALHMERIQSKGALGIEQATLSLALIDPPMTEDEVKAWQKVSLPGEIEPITAKVGELSALRRQAEKESYKSI